MVVRSIISVLSFITVNNAVMLEHPTHLDDVLWNNTKAGIVLQEELIEHFNSDQHVRTHVQRNVPTPARILEVKVQNHIPMNESYICLSYPLMTTGRCLCYCGRRFILYVSSVQIGKSW